MKSANLLVGQQDRRPADKMTSPQCDTSDTLTRARVSVLFHPKKAPPVTLTCPKCGHAVTLEVPGAAYCQPCRQPMRPEGEGG